MNTPISLFRKSFFYSIMAIAILNIITQAYPLTFGVLNSDDHRNIFIWGQQNLYTLLLTFTFVMVSPWLILMFFGEWFNTRSLDRKSLFKMVWHEYIKWLLPIILGLVLVSLSTQYFLYSTMSRKNIPETLFLVSLSIYLVLVVSGNTNILLKTLKFGAPIFIFSAIFYDFGVNGYKPGKWLTYLIWSVFLIYYYKVIVNYDGDIDLNVPGCADDENKAISALWIFNKEFISKNIKLYKTNNPLVKFLDQFKLIVSQTKVIYLQLILIFATIVFFFAISYSFTGEFHTIFDKSYYGYERYNFFERFIFIFSAILMLFSFINPRYLISSREEFLLTRPISKSKIYIYNFFTQGLFFVLIFIFFLLLAKISDKENLLGNFNLLPLIFTFVWLFISGELGVILICGLFSFDFTMELLGSSLYSELYSSFLLNLHTASYFSFSLWLSAIFFRLWDYYWFNNKEIGCFKGFSATFKEFAKIYLPAGTLMFAVLVLTTILNPLTKFINTIPGEKYSFDNSERDVIKAIFFKENKEDEDSFYIGKFNSDLVPILKKLLHKPFDKPIYLEMAKFNLEVAYRRASKTYRTYFYKRAVLTNQWWSIANFPEKADYWMNLSSELKDTGPYLYNLSLAYLLNDEFPQALETAKKASELSPTPEYFNNLGMLYEHEFLYSKAIASYEKAFKASGNKSGEYLRRIGSIYWNNRLYDKAIDYYAQTVISDEKMTFPQKPYYYYGLCSKLSTLKKDTNNLNLLRDLELALFYCNDKKINKKLFNSPISRYKIGQFLDDETGLYFYISQYIDYNDFTSQGYSYSRSLNGGKWYQKHGNNQKAKKLYMERNFNDELALISINENKLDEAQNYINKSLQVVNYSKSEGIQDIKNSIYKYRTFLAMLKLNKEKNPVDIAQKLLIIAPDTNEAWKEIGKIFTNNRH